MVVEGSQQRLLELRVRDVMAQPVVSVPSCHTMCEAAEQLAASELSAAPVVDEAGRCIGMITATDFLKRDARQCAVDRLSCRGGELHVERGPGASLQIAETDHDRVWRHMTPAVQTVAAEASIVDAARQMCLLHVHHLPVLDPTGRPVGMLSSLDLASALSNAMDEQLGDRRRG